MASAQSALGLGVPQQIYVPVATGAQPVAVPTTGGTTVVNYSQSRNGSAFISFLITWIVLFLIFWLWKASWLQNKDENGQPNGTLNFGLALLYSLIGAIIIGVLVYVWKR